ncbi:hypothetical protein KA036_01080 [Candidatus Gracilibacteria bacterium]|nr:hypothetical protein [Candidatus Gracilibacteria bacterium]
MSNKPSEGGVVEVEGRNAVGEVSGCSEAMQRKRDEFKEVLKAAMANKTAPLTAAAGLTGSASHCATTSGEHLAVPRF